MKTMIFSLIVAPAVAFAVGPDLTLYNAQRKGAEAKISLRVTDQDGESVADAKISLAVLMSMQTRRPYER